jgi:peptidoglycan hydrolase-like protein with peptidoglycan-binding domain
MTRWEGVLDGRRVLAEGDEGEAVVELQRLLRLRGYRVRDHGRFGPSTASAVRELQVAAGIFADGVVGRRTARALSAGHTASTPGPSTLHPRGFE